MIFKGYISSRKLLDGSINHQKVQNLVIRDACHKRKYEYKLSLTEYGVKNCFLAFNQILLEIEKDKFDGIAFYSLTQLPEKKADREKLYKIIIKKKKKILFSLENKLVSNISEIRKLENLLKIKYLLKFTPKKIKY
jgi:sporadic carbohydrate cluster protein (TIGR04323 family)